MLAPVDSETYEAFLKLERYARVQGRSLIEVLNEAEMLLTPRRKLQIQVAALENLQRRYLRQSPNKLMSFALGRVEGTSMDMFESVVVWNETLIRNWANGTLEDL